MNMKVLYVVSYWRGLLLWMGCPHFPPGHVVMLIAVRCQFVEQLNNFVLILQESLSILINSGHIYVLWTRCVYRAFEKSLHT